MGVDAEELLIRPFRDVVTLGSTAMANAAAVSHDDQHARAADMAKAAQSLVREGERALKRLQAVWNDHVEKYGDAFKEIMVQQASIERRRFQLEELLWDFDDVTKPDEFSQSRYSALQAATKALALDIIETARRLNPDAISTDPPPIPRGGFPPLPPLPTHRGFYQPRQSAPASPPLSPLSKGFSDITLDASVTPSQSQNQQTSDYVPVSGPPSTMSTKTASIMSRNSMTSSSALMTTPSDSPYITELTEDASSPLTPTALPLPAVEDGLMLMEDLLRETSSSSSNRNTIMRRRTNPRIPDCSIGTDSTYHRLRGICKGATKFRRDGHWDSIQRTSDESEDMMRASDGIMVPLSYGSGYDEDDEKVGKCSACFYSHDWDEVEADKSNSLSAVQSCASIISSPQMTPSYRLRLLYKSHLPLQSPSDEPLYACLWCVHSSQTTRESDATVFFSASTLLRHIARHPQPLSPSIPGLAVSYGPGPPPPAPVDIHLPSSPVPVPIPENVDRLPTARAIKDHLNPRQKPPKYPEEGEMLHFAEGAVIVGVIFPEKWEGKWCLGRHDGCFGAFPAKLVEVRAPQEGEVPRGGESGMSVVARWKWEAPSGTSVGGKDSGWVSFGKGEIIRDVQCLYADYWCWSGTNSKGKTGVFPSSHVDLSTLRGQ
ncbi:hypothetical protein QBC44DRAFT_214946, partial [Cladorrhinum sp. PSN332]